MSESRSSTERTQQGREAPESERSIREAHVTIPESEFDVIGIGKLVSRWRDAGLLNVKTIACEDTGAVVQVDLQQPLDPDGVTDIEEGDWCESVPSSGDSRRYVVRFTAPTFPPSLARREADLLDAPEFELMDQGLTVSLVGFQRDVSDVVAEYEAAGLSPQLRKFGKYDGGCHPLDALTDRQREVLETAYEMGYFEVPRKAGSEAVAVELSMDASTVTEHLQRAERNLLTRHFSGAHPEFACR